jgi:hypothetical protein
VRINNFMICAHRMGIEWVQASGLDALLFLAGVSFIPISPLNSPTQRLVDADIFTKQSRQKIVPRIKTLI